MKFSYVAIPVVVIALAWLFMAAPTSEVVSPQGSLPTASNTLQGQVQSQGSSLAMQQQAMNNTLPEVLENSSLKGTQIDGLYPVDAQGHLVLADDIKHRFEYFLSLMGEFPLDAILQMVRDDIELNLQEPARAEALTLFNDYIAYKRNLVALENQLDAPADYEVDDIQRLRYQLQQLRNLRSQYLGDAVADAFFGFDDIYDDYMLNRIEITNNRQLSDSEKQAQLDALQQQLPAELNDMRAETARVSQAFHHVEELKAAGADDQAVFEYNSQQFGQEAALRLQQLEQTRAQWQARINDYLQHKSRIETDDSLTDDEKTAAIETLRQQQFDVTERKRLAAYE